MSAFLQAALIAFSLNLAWFLRNDFAYPHHHMLLWATLVVVGVRLLAIRSFNLLHGWWDFTDMNDAVDVAKSVAVGSAGFVIVFRFLLNQWAFPPSIYLFEAFLTFGALLSIRVLTRLMAEILVTGPEARRTILVGAGFSAQLIVRDLKTHPDFDVVGYVDDDPTKWGIKLLGAPVFGPVDDLPELVRKHSVSQILIAIPSATGRQMRRFVDIIELTGCKYQTVPTLKNLISGVPAVKQLREVSMEDLLGREPVKLDVDGIRSQVAGKYVMVTGAAGSIGSELCRQILSYGPAALVCVDHNENGMFYLERELSSKPFADRVKYVIADLGSQPRMEVVFNQYPISIIFHAAAYKHVGMMEHNVSEAIRNNVLGLLSLLRFAENAGCKRFVMISSDKAVNPTSVMGCTKRICEMILAARPTPMDCIAVRFGNVLGSNGSLIPLLQSQLRAKKPLTITHRDVTRYFMTINEAVSLVLQAAVLGKSREILVLDMGDPIKIVDLARTVARLSGHTDDVPMVFTGLRKGEKLYEELFYDHERKVSTECLKVNRTVSTVLPWTTLGNHVDALRRALLYADDNELRMMLRDIVPQFQGCETLTPTETEAVRAIGATTSIS